MAKKIPAILLILMCFLIFVSCETLKYGKMYPQPKTKESEEKTLPAPFSTGSMQNEADKSLRFVVMADCRGMDNGVNTEIVKKTLECIKKVTPQPSFAVMPGDLVEGSKDYTVIKAQLLNFKNIVTKYYPAAFFYPGFGNHEAIAGAEGEKAFMEVFPEFAANFLTGYNRTVYYFDKGNARFYMLNSDHPGEEHIVSDTQLNWIKTNTNMSKAHAVYFFHEPAYPTGSHAGSSLDVFKLQRDKFWEIIDMSKSPITFCGHEHNYTRRHINPNFNEIADGREFKFRKLVYQVTTGSFGAPLINVYTDKRDVDVPPVAEYNFAVVDISGSRIAVTVYNLDGEVIDRFLYS